MARTPRRWPALLVGAATVGGLGLLVTAAAASTAGSSFLIIRFQAVGDASCATAPDQSSLTVSAGTRVVFLNRTGHDGAVVVGEQTEQVDDGSAVGLTIAVGQYDIRLVDECGSAAVSQPVALTVTAAGSSPTPTDGGAPGTVPSPETTALTGGAAPTDGQGGADGSGTVGPTPGDDVRSPAQAVGSTSPTPTPPSGPVADQSPVLAVTPVGLDDAGGNPKDVRLLAVVAAICVLGVTAAIIRSIVRLSP
jgi:hypothetical protein